MRYVVAVVGGAVMFILVFLLVGIGIGWLAPLRFVSYPLSAGALETNVGSAIAFLFGVAAAIHTFRASLKRRAKRADAEQSKQQLLM